MVGGRVLVGGGTGFVGGAVVKALERRGYEAIIISRYFEWKLPDKSHHETK